MISNSGHDENGRYSGGMAGDQTGGEWALIPWYSRPWNYVLRHPDADVRETLAQLSEEAARNDNVGYDQGQRTTYWTQLARVGYRPSKITVKCESDCSAGVAANVKATGYLLGIDALKNVSKDCYTGNLRAALKKAGFQVLTDSKYLTSDRHLLRGDILLLEHHHTAVNVTNGSLSGTSGASTNTSSTINTGSATDNVGKGQKWLNSNYGTLLKKNLGALLEVDNSYGKESRKAALCVWKDVVNRKYGAKLTTNNFNFYDSCKEAAKMAQIRKGASGTLTYILEFILSAKGYYTGAMDALFGDGLDAAVRTFQKAKGLTVDGIVGPATWYALFN